MVNKVKQNLVAAFRKQGYVARWKRGIKGNTICSKCKRFSDWYLLVYIKEGGIDSYCEECAVKEADRLMGG